MTIRTDIDGAPALTGPWPDPVVPETSLPEWPRTRPSGCWPAGRIGPLPDAMKPGFHGVGTHWIRGFMAFQLARRTRIVMLMVPV